MRRRDSRILLEVTDVRVELLQDISEEQAEAEDVGFLRHAPDADETLTAAQLFECLWSSINGDESWNGDPWVWVVEFKRIEPSPDQTTPSAGQLAVCSTGTSFSQWWS